MPSGEKNQIAEARDVKDAENFDFSYDNEDFQEVTAYILDFRFDRGIVTVETSEGPYHFERDSFFIVCLPHHSLLELKVYIIFIIRRYIIIKKSSFKIEWQF